MAQCHSAKIKVDRISQIAVVVHNLPMVVENYWNIMGVGPWNVFNWDYPTVEKRTYHARPAWAREKICHAQLENVEFELMQPVDGPSVYGDALEEHGEGVHHLQFCVADLDETVRILTEDYGFPSIQSGVCGKTPKGCRYNYVYIEPLSCIWEVVQCTEGIRRGPDYRYPAEASPSPAEIKVTKFSSVAIVVRDARRTAESYRDILGIGPWEIYDLAPPALHNRKYQGEATWGIEKLAVADVGGVKLELIQPVAGQSIFRDHLEKHGEGLHSIGCTVPDPAATAAILAADGFPTLQKANYGPVKQGGGYTYVDIPPLRAIFRLDPVVPVDWGITPEYLPGEA
jgi:catechol 2,3-dioxygenase-like lactoylglutathione lyase family enzyme